MLFFSIAPYFWFNSLNGLETTLAALLGLGVLSSQLQRLDQRSEQKEDALLGHPLWCPCGVGFLVRKCLILNVIPALSQRFWLAYQNADATASLVSAVPPFAPWPSGGAGC